MPNNTSPVDNQLKFLIIEACDKLTEFTCNSGQCIPKHYKCDGYDDCDDSGDEMNCGKFFGQKKNLIF